MIVTILLGIVGAASAVHRSHAWMVRWGRSGRLYHGRDRGDCRAVRLS